MHFIGKCHDGRTRRTKNLFSYGVDLDRRVRADNPLRLIRQRIDFTWVREEVAQFYGTNGNVSVDPVIILKLMFLLFYDDVKCERELMRIVPERLDYLWFLGLGLDDERRVRPYPALNYALPRIYQPDHSLRPGHRSAVPYCYPMLRA